MLLLQMDGLDGIITSLILSLGEKKTKRVTAHIFIIPSTK